MLFSLVETVDVPEVLAIALATSQESFTYI
jgi:hypothetical protein